MTLDEYQQIAIRTLPPEQINGTASRWWVLKIRTLGLVAEVGEVAGCLEKTLGQHHALTREIIKNELGDVLWSLATLVYCAGLSLEDVAEYNNIKLQKRYPNGFTAKDSIERKDQHN